MEHNGSSLHLVTNLSTSCYISPQSFRPQHRSLNRRSRDIAAYENKGGKCDKHEQGKACTSLPAVVQPDQKRLRGIG